MNLYVTMFTTGEYSDHHEQPLAVFLTKDEADQHTQNLIEEYEDWKNYADDYSKELKWVKSKPYSLEFSYNGPDFFTTTIKLGDGALKDTLLQEHPEVFL